MCQRQVQFPGIGPQTANGVDCVFGQFQARVGVIEPEEINAVVRSSQLRVGHVKEWIASHGLLQQLHGLEQFFPGPGAE